MLLIDNELELQSDFTFEDFTKNKFYANRPHERNGAVFILGSFGIKHRIQGLEGKYFVTLIFQDTLQRVLIERAYSNIASMNTADKCDSQFFAVLLRDELIEKIIEQELIKIDYDRREDDSYAVFIIYKEYNPEFSKTHDIWAD